MVKEEELRDISNRNTESEANTLVRSKDKQLFIQNN